MSSEVEIAKDDLGEDGDRQVAAEHSQGITQAIEPGVLQMNAT
jgi:hypothetical protein